ncbi:MAG: phosphate acyltransferase PlsX [Candidatus Kerfeldbacteria bacterium]
MSSKIVIAIDAMGGDNYPESPVLGALMALDMFSDIEVQLVGVPSIISDELGRLDTVVRKKLVTKHSNRIKIIDASDVIPMDFKKSADVLTRRESSIFIGSQGVKKGDFHAFVSAGNTGALLAAAYRRIARISGISRPALSVVFPTANGPCVGLDVGANAENTVKHLIQFGIMGKIYSQMVLGVRVPRVALMNIGEEDSKGPPLYIEVHRQLRELSNRGIINFIGNVQGGDIFSGKADVIIFDGLLGNVLLKQAESLIPTLKGAIQRKLSESSFFHKVVAGTVSILLKSLVGAIRKEFDYQQYGGVPFLGVNGVVVKAHGKSTPLAIMHAIRVAREACVKNLVGVIRQEISSLSI